MPIKKKKKIEYCVHIYPEAIEIDDIKATSPKMAERMARLIYEKNAESPAFTAYGIYNVEVKRVHHCSKDEAYDNDLNNNFCDNCGSRLK